VNGLRDEQNEDADQSDLFQAHWRFLQPSDSLTRGLPVRRYRLCVPNPGPQQNE
jgi:hypothetical protein